ncbi:hypothetical protein BV22DRAFT_1039603 [Leucogyrophana mollusca]|uniref:Uncharacterized protein n=1 Tax=Leucogyrophana mollusca TaxID=85980 RepID=A0ACB8B625_9AGAM|nr:hypothetical protein BV22DRAFT_1039603 [Leucogyrophana mollusca]
MHYLSRTWFSSMRMWCLRPTSLLSTSGGDMISELHAECSDGVLFTETRCLNRGAEGPLKGPEEKYKPACVLSRRPLLCVGDDMH